MPAPVVVKFAINGEKEVLSAFDSVMARARKMNDQVANDSVRSADKRVRAAKQGADREMRELEKLVSRWQKEEEKKVSAAQKTAKRISDVQAKEAARAAREFEKTEREKTRAFTREVKSRHDAEARASAEIVKNARQNAGKTSQLFGRAGRSAIGTVSGLAAGVGLTAGSLAIGAAVMENMQLNKQAALLVNSTRDKTGAATQSVAGLTGEAQGLAKQYGLNATDVMGAMGTVAARAGGGEGLSKYRKDIDDITKTAVAFGVSMQDMGGLVAAALQAGVEPGTEMRELIQDIAAMGKDGAVEISDLAQELARLSGAGYQTELSKSAMIRRQVGLAQIAVKQQVSPEEARTSVKDFINDISLRSDTLKRSGVATRGASGLLLDPAEILANTIHAAETTGIKGERGRVTMGAEGLFGGKDRIFSGTSKAIATEMLNVYKQAGGGETGRKAILASIDKSSGAKLAAGERDKGLATVMDTEAMKMDQNMAAFKAEMGKLLPEFTKLMPAITNVTQAFAKLAVWAAQNPFTALGGIFAAYLTKELAAAAVGNTFKLGVQSMLAAQGSLGGGVGVKGNLAAFGTIAITAAAVYLTATKVIDELDASKKREGKAQFSAVTEAENLMTHSQYGTLTEEDRKKAATLAATLKSQQEAGRGVEMPTGIKALAAIPALAPLVGIGMGGVAAYNKFTEASREAGAGGSTEQLPGMIDAMTKLATASDKLNTAADKIASADLSNPGNGARSGVPVGMGR